MENEDKKSSLKEKYSKKNTDIGMESKYSYEDNKPENDIDYSARSFSLSKKAKVIIGLIVVVIIVVGVGLSLGKKQMNISKTVSRAENLQALGKYDEAEEILNNLFMSTGDEKYKEMIRYNSLLKKNEEIMEDGLTYLEYNDYISSIEQFSYITEEDKKHYDQAQKQIEVALDKAIIEIQHKIDKEEQIDANGDVERLEVLLPGNKKVEDLRAKVDALKDKLEEKEKEENAEFSSGIETTDTSVSNKEYDDRKILDSMEKMDRRVLEEASAMIKDSYETITAKNSNLRNAPSKDASIVKTLQKGTEVYIEDTYVESVDRIWCKVSYDGATGWISYNTMNGTIA